MNEIELLDISPPKPLHDDPVPQSEPAPEEPWVSASKLGDNFVEESSPYDSDGRMRPAYAAALRGKVGQQLGFTPADDAGIIGEIANSSRRGWEYLKQSWGKTYGWDEVVAESEAFLNSNRHLFDTENESTASKVVGFLAEQTVMNAPTILATIGTAFLSRWALGAFSGIAAEGANILRTAQTLRRAGQVVEAASAMQRYHKLAATANKIVNLSSRSAGGVMNYSLMYGNNKETIAERCPGLSESEQIVYATGLTLFHTFVEQGIGVQSALGRAMSTGAFGRMLAQEGVDKALTQAYRPLVLGRLAKLGSRWKGSFAREWASVSAGEAVEEMMQSGGTDLLTRVLSGQPDSRTWQEIYRDYRNDAALGALGGAWLGLLPVSISAMARHSRMAKMESLTVPDQSAVDDVASNNAGTPSGAEVNGQPAYINSEPFLRTEFFFQGVAKALGGDTAANDIALKLKVLAYNLAHTELVADRAQGIASKIAPESYFDSIITMVQNDPARSAELRNAVAKDNASGGKTSYMLDLVQSWSPDMRGNIRRWADTNELFDLRRSNDALAKEVPFSFAAAERDANSAVAMPAIRKAIGYDSEGDEVVFVAKNIQEGDEGGGMLSESASESLRAQLGDPMLREMYARGTLVRGIAAVVGGKQVDLVMRITRNPIRGNLEFRLYNASHPKVQEALKREDAKTTDKIEAMDAKRGIKVDETALANERMRTLMLGDAIERMAEYDEFSKKNPIAEPTTRPRKTAKPAVAPAVAATPAAEPAAVAQPEVAATGEEATEETIQYEEDADYGRTALTPLGEPGARGFYANDVIMLMAGWKADTVLHEVFHHLISNAILPQDIYDTLVKNFFAPAGDDDPVAKRLRGKSGVPLGQEDMMRWV